MQKDWIAFPPHFSAPTVRSLCLLFILEELSTQFPKTTIPKDLREIEELLGLKTPLPPNPLVLDKLSFYCSLLVKSSQIDGKNLQKHLETLRLTFLQFRSEILQQPDLVWEKAKTLHELWKEKLVSFFTLLIPFLQEARTDENILLSLCEKKNLFDVYLGETSIERLLCSFFPKGDMDWQSVLTEGFRRRHFVEFLKEKEHLFEKKAYAL